MIRTQTYRLHERPWFSVLLALLISACGGGGGGDGEREVEEGTQAEEGTTDPDGLGDTGRTPQPQKGAGSREETRSDEALSVDPREYGSPEDAIESMDALIERTDAMLLTAPAERMLGDSAGSTPLTRMLDDQQQRFNRLYGRFRKALDELSETAADGGADAR